MLTKRLCFQDVETVERFLKLSETVPFSMDLVCGSCAVDGKSILGILSFGLNKTVELCMYTDDSAGAEAFADQLGFCLCEEQGKVNPRVPV